MTLCTYTAQRFSRRKRMGSSRTKPSPTSLRAASTYRGFETNGYVHLREARACFVQWGAKGKVRQLDERYPRLTAGSATSSAAPKGLDVVSVVKASQDMSGEIEAQRLIERLMTIALQTAGADRALLIPPHVKDDRIAAEAHAGVDGMVLQQSSSFDLAAPEIPAQLCHTYAGERDPR